MWVLGTHTEVVMLVPQVLYPLSISLTAGPQLRTTDISFFFFSNLWVASSHGSSGHNICRSMFIKTAVFPSVLAASLGSVPLGQYGVKGRRKCSLLTSSSHTADKEPTTMSMQSFFSLSQVFLFACFQYCFGDRISCVAESGLDLSVLLPQPPGFWDY